MSYFDDASLVMIPSGYKDQKVYSVKPIDGSGDLTFSRASSATRVNSSGLVEKVRENLLTYSQDFSNVIWSKGNVTITGSQTDPNGGTTATSVDPTDAASGTIKQTVTLTSGVTYTWSVYIKGSTTGQSVALYTDGASNIYSKKDITTSWQRFTVQAPATSSGFSGFYILCGSGYGLTDLPFYIAFAQVEASDIVTDYIATTSSAVSVGPVSGLPRLDYSGGATCPKLLLEPQRTNLATYSEQFNNAAWSTSDVTVTANTTISPSGYQDADTINATAADQRINQTITVSASTQYTFSFYAKKGTMATPRYSVYDVSNSDLILARVDYSSLVNTSTWSRVTATFTTPAGCTSIFVYPINGASTGTIFLWGAQLEAGAYATSYIPTLSTAVTRVPDGLGTLNIATLCPTSNYSIFFEIDNSNLTDPSTWLFLASSSGSGDPFQIYASTAIINTASGYIYPFSYIPSSNASGKVCLTYNGTTTKVFKDGVLVGQYTANANWANKTTLNFTHNPTQKNNIKQILLFPSALTDAQAIELTTL